MLVWKAVVSKIINGMFNGIMVWTLCYFCFDPVASEIVLLGEQNALWNRIE